MFFIKKMDETTAVKISTWKYEEPYSIYSMDGSVECIDEFMCGDYYSVTDEEEKIIGFYCFGKAAQVPAGNQHLVYKDNDYVDIGLGMRPDLCGKGFGEKFLSSGIQFAKAMYSTDKIRLTVADFNKRAIKLYEKSGFKRKLSFDRAKGTTISKFHLMILE